MARIPATTSASLIFVFGPRFIELAQPFVDRWGVRPPQNAELLDSDPRRRVVESLASGSWGIITIFPWTTLHEIRRQVMKIRRAIPKRHQDAFNTRAVQLAAWLRDGCDFDRPTIARALGRRTGLHRLTTAQALDRTADDLEKELHAQYRALGFKGRELNRRVYQRLRGSEPPASAALRMADRRYLNRQKRLEETLEAPLRSEPLSYALTKLFRELPEADDTTLRRCVAAAKTAAVKASRPPGKRIGRFRDARDGSVDPLSPGRWGIVPVFPWTTDSHIRRLAKNIRRVIRSGRHDIPHQDNGCAIVHADPWSSPLTAVFLALCNDDDGGVRKHSIATHRALVNTPSS